MSIFSSIKKGLKAISKAIPLKKTLRTFVAPAVKSIPIVGPALSTGLTTALNIERRLFDKQKKAGPPTVRDVVTSVVRPPQPSPLTGLTARQLAAVSGRAIRPTTEAGLRPIIAGTARFAPAAPISMAQQFQSFLRQSGRTAAQVLGRIPPPIIPTSPGEAGVAAFGALIPRAAGALARPIGIAVTTTGVIRGVQTTSGFFSRRNMVALAKKVGLEAAALALGITVVDMATAVADEQRRPRRRRGISGRDVATTRRTIRMIKSMACAAGISTTTPRRRSCAPRKSCR